MSPEVLQQLRAGAAKSQSATKGSLTWENGRFNTNKKISGRGGPLTAFISEGGGAGGAWAGGAAGAALGSVVPGIGTVIGGVLGAGIGGLAGALGGKALENKVRDDQNFTGKGGSAKAAWTEGAISGALGAAGKGVTAARGLSALGRGTTGGGMRAGVSALSNYGDDAAKAAAGKSILAGGKKAGLALAGESVDGRLVSGASRLESRALGFGQGEKIAGKQVKPKDVKSLFSIMDKEGIKSGHPDQVGKQIEARLTSITDDIEKTIKSANRAVTSAEQTALKDAFTKAVSKDIAITSDKTARQLASTLNKQMGKISTFEDIVKQRRSIQDLINYARSTTGVEPAKEKVYQLAQRQLNELANGISPELKALNGRYAGLTKLQQATLNSSKSLGSQSRNSMGGVMGSLKAGDTATTLKSVLGAAGRNVGTTTDAIAGSVPMKLGKGMAVRGAINSSVGAMDQAQQDPAQYDQALNDLGMNDMSGGQDMTQTQQQPQAELYPAQNMMQDIQNDFQATGGRNVDKYLSLYKALSAVTASQNKASGLNVTKPTSEKLSNAQSGMDSVGQLRQILANNPELVGKSSVPGRGLPVVGGLVSKALGTTDYDAQAYNMMDNLLRIRTGAQANPTEIKKYVTSLLPRLGDSPAEAERKLQIFEKQFGDILQLAGAPNQGGQESYLQDAILNSGGSM